MWGIFVVGSLFFGAIETTIDKIAIVKDKNISDLADTVDATVMLVAVPMAGIVVNPCILFLFLILSTTRNDARGNGSPGVGKLIT